MQPTAYKESGQAKTQHQQKNNQLIENFFNWSSVNYKKKILLDSQTRQAKSFLQTVNLRGAQPIMKLLQANPWT